jgi:hypothetical protein
MTPMDLVDLVLLQPHGFIITAPITKSIHAVPKASLLYTSNFTFLNIKLLISLQFLTVNSLPGANSLPMIEPQ